MCPGGVLRTHPCPCTGASRLQFQALYGREVRRKLALGLCAEKGYQVGPTRSAWRHGIQSLPLPANARVGKHWSCNLICNGTGWVVHGCWTTGRASTSSSAQVHLSTLTALPTLSVPIKCCDNSRSICAAAHAGLHTDEIDREWIYDTGAATCCIGWGELTADEKSRTYSIPTQKFITANGPSSCSLAVDCNIPFLGIRQVQILKDCPPAISVTAAS